MKIAKIPVSQTKKEITLILAKSDINEFDEGHYQKLWEENHLNHVILRQNAQILPEKSFHPSCSPFSRELAELYLKSVKTMRAR